MASSTEVLQMAEVPPQGFLCLDDAARKKGYSLVNVMGIVSDHLGASRTRGTDWQQTFTIVDSTTYASTVVPHGLRIKFFRSTEAQLPKVRGKGDVVVFRNLKISIWQGQVVGLSAHSTECVVFPGPSLPTKDHREAYATSGNWIAHFSTPAKVKPTIHEQQWAISLYDTFPEHHSSYADPEVSGEVVQNGSDRPVNSDKVVFMSADDSTVTGDSLDNIRSTNSLSSSSAKPAVAPRYDKNALIKDVETNKFYDLAVQVVKMFSGQFEALELSVTDYTVNPLLYDHKESDAHDKSRGPFGRRILKTELLAPHASWAQEHVKEGDFILLKNMRIKLSKSGQVEGNLWLDSLHPERINVTLLDKTDPRIASLVDRKELYKKQHPRALGTDQTRPSRKSQKQRNAARHRASNMQQDNHEEQTPEGTLPSTTTQPPALNPHIKCVFPNSITKPVPLSAITGLTRTHTTPKGNAITLPFVNFRAYTTARVIDYFPADLRDFAHPTTTTTTANNLNPTQSPLPSPRTATQPPQTSQEWQWRFQLLLEDASASAPSADNTTSSTTSTTTTPPSQLPVLVAGPSATFLFDGVPPCNLHAEAAVLAALKEKLFLLWGDLQEQKDAVAAAGGVAPAGALAGVVRPHGLPFVCCVDEYGVRRGEADAETEGEAGAEVEAEGGVSVDGGGGDDAAGQWVRCHRLCLTRIM